MKIVTQDGRLFQGTPTQIVMAMRACSMTGSHLDLKEFVVWVAENVHRQTGTAIEVSGDTDDEWASSLLNALLSAGLAKRL